MKLVLTGLENPIEIVPGLVTTLQVENEALFARVARSIVSLQGREAVEPFTLWEDDAEVKPSLQFRQVPHARLKGTDTRSPTLIRFTADPTSSTMPMFSWP